METNEKAIIELLQREKEVIAAQMQAMKAGEMASAYLKAYCSAIIERCGHSADKDWTVSPDMTKLVEVSDGMAR